MSQPTRTRRGYLAVTLTASGGTFLAMLDSTVTYLAVPNLQQDFPSASVPDLSWVISGYAVAFAALLAPAGRLADALGRRRLFLGGMSLFLITSLLCALAPSLEMLVVTRILQGASAAAMIPASLAVLLLDGPADRRASSIGTWSAASAAAAAIGPVVGGALVGWFDWRAVFVVNLPFGVILIIAAMRLLPRAEKADIGRIPDLIGTALIAIGVGAATLGVTEGGSWGWGDVKTLACIIGGVVVIVLALLRSRTHPSPAIETSLWRNRTFAAANVVSLCYGMSQYPFMLVSVLFLTGTWHYTELSAGLANTPGAVSAAIAALAMGRLGPRIGLGPRFATLFGLTAFGACCVWFIFGLTDHPSFWTLWFPAAVLLGTGMGSATTGTSSAAALSAPPALFATSSGVNTTARQFGGALGVAAVAVILQSGTASTGLRAIQAYRNVFEFCIVLIVLAMVITAVWVRLRPPAPAPAPAPTPERVAEPATVED